MEPEFLEVLQTLCTIVTITLDTAQQYQQERHKWQSATYSPKFSHLSLSDQLANILSSARLTLVGTEQPLTPPLAYVFLQTAETFTSDWMRLLSAHLHGGVGHSGSDYSSD